jgi:hypothetical protein
VGPKSEWRTVVGVAADVKLTGPDDRNAKLGLYTPLSRDEVGRFPIIVLRTSGNPERLIPAVRRIVREIDPDSPSSAS